MASFLAPASARHPSTLVSVLLPHHRPATRRISNFHLPPAVLLCFTRSYTIPRSGCPVASSSPVLPLRTPVDESLGYSRASRRSTRRPLVLPGAAAAARAFGTVCFLRVAVFATCLSLSRLARCRSITKSAASGGNGELGPKDAAEDSDKDDGSREPPFTPIMLNEILFGRQTDFAKIRLLRHVFTTVLPRVKQLQLLELVYELAFPENHKIKQEVFSKNWLRGSEKLEAGLAMTQIYIQKNNYKDAEQVLKRLEEECEPPDLEARVPLLNAVVKVMLAVDRLRSKRNAVTEQEVEELHDLIVKCNDCFDAYKSRRSPPDTNGTPPPGE